MIRESKEEEQLKYFKKCEKNRIFGFLKSKNYEEVSRHKMIYSEKPDLIFEFYDENKSILTPEDLKEMVLECSRNEC